MSTVAEIIKAADALDAEEFLRLRMALDRVEERLWDHELSEVMAKRRNGSGRTPRSMNWS